MAEQKIIEGKVIIPYDNGILKTDQELSIHKPTEDTPIKASI